LSSFSTNGEGRMSSERLTVDQAAERLKLHAKTVLRLIYE
jgi:hypothetical protein